MHKKLVLEYLTLRLNLCLCLLYWILPVGSYSMTNDRINQVDSITDKHYTYIRLLGTNEKTISISYVVTGICPSDLKFYVNQPANKVIPIQLECPLMNFGDEISGL